MEQRIYIGVDLGGTGTKLIAGDDNGKVLSEQRCATESQKGPQAVLASIVSMAKEALREAGAKPHAMGIGIPGIVDISEGKTVYLPNFPGHWPGVQVRQELEKQVGCPVYILNDVKVATLGEMIFGIGKGVQSMILMAIGTGLGGGIVINGKLNLGHSGAAGELGHLQMIPEGMPCGCGSRGCLETIVSGPALSGAGVQLMLAGQAPKLFEIVGGRPGQVTTKAMSDAANAGDGKVREAIARAGHYLGTAISNLIVALEPELVVIGGGVAGLGDLLLEPTRQAVRETVKIYPADKFRIEPSQVGEGAGVMGALALALEGGSPKHF